MDPSNGDPNKCFLRTTINLPRRSSDDNEHYFREEFSALRKLSSAVVMGPDAYIVVLNTDVRGGGSDLMRSVEEPFDRFTLECDIWSVLAQLACALYCCHYKEDPPRPGFHKLSVNAHEKSDGVSPRTIGFAIELKHKHTTLKLHDFNVKDATEQTDSESVRDCSSRSDIWQLGCVISKLCRVKFPKTDQNGTSGPIMPFQNLLRDRPYSSGYSEQLIHIMRRCLSNAPEERPSSNELLLQCGVILARQYERQKRYSDDAEVMKGNLAKSSTLRDGTHYFPTPHTGGHYFPQL